MLLRFTVRNTYKKGGASEKSVWVPVAKKIPDKVVQAEPVADLLLSAVRICLMVVICPSTAVKLLSNVLGAGSVDRVAVGSR
jgi:hypothetical protein